MLTRLSIACIDPNRPYQIRSYLYVCLWIIELALRQRGPVRPPSSLPRLPGWPGWHLIKVHYGGEAEGSGCSETPRSMLYVDWTACGAEYCGSVLPILANTESTESRSRFTVQPPFFFFSCVWFNYCTGRLNIGLHAQESCQCY